MALRHSHYISAKSKYVAKRIRSYGVVAPMDVNYWGADLDKFYPGDQVVARRALGLDENQTIILSSRALEPRLNIPMIVEAFRAVLMKYPDSLLVLLGRSTPDYKGQVEETIRRFNLSDNVRIVGDVSQHVLPQYYQASNAVVSMANSEGFPNTLLEVMACKVPIVVGRIAQIEELLENGRNAWICDFKPDSIAAAILDALENKDKTLRISNAAYATAKEYANIKKNGSTFSTKLKNVSVSFRTGGGVNMIAFRLLYALYRLQRKIASVIEVNYV